MLPDVDERLRATASLIQESRYHIVRLRGVFDDARRQAQLAMSLIEETRSYLARIDGRPPPPSVPGERRLDVWLTEDEADGQGTGRTRAG
jgi:hypothetical protein